MLSLTPPDTTGFLKHLLCADAHIPPHDTALRTMLTNSIWRARSEAGQGASKEASEWKNWIVDDCLTRVGNINPSFFDSHYTTNTIPPRYKITRKANLGSSSGTPEQKATARKVIATHLERLPANVRYIFTDGSAKPNPGPAGSGVVVVSTSDHTTHIHARAAALGHSTNNMGEIAAIGIGIELCVADNYNNDIYVYTDSRLTHNALRFNHSAGAENSHVIQHLRQCIRNYQNLYKAKIHINWIPGHSGIPLNDVADSLAGVGADVSNYYSSDFNLINVITTHGYKHLLTLTELAAPWVKAHTVVNTVHNVHANQIVN